MCALRAPNRAIVWRKWEAMTEVRGITSMRYLIRALLFGAAAVAVALPAHEAQSQAPRNQPRTPFAVSDFAKLRWLQGSWEGTAVGEASTFQRFRFVDDTTVE